MITIYGMNTCPDCVSVKKQIKGRENEFTYLEIGDDVSYFKEFLKMRDNAEALVKARANGMVGIPCFVLADGTVTVCPEDAGLVTEERKEVKACSIEDHENGVAGC